MTAAAPIAPVVQAKSSRIAAWAAWDWGSAAFNAVVTTFVFTVYLTSGYFIDPSLKAGTPAYVRAEAHLTSNLSLGIGLAGVVVAFVAPVLGWRSDAAGRRKRWLGINTAVLVATMLGMFFVVGQPSYFLFGVVLVAVGTVFYEVASVNYNAMLPRLAPRDRLGRISAVGWASGYFGGIVLLVLVYFTLISGSHHLFGIVESDGLNIRIVALCCAVWCAVFSIPVLLAVPEIPPVERGPRVTVWQTYVEIARYLRALWTTRREVIAFLIASAVFRDGLAGVFLYGGIIASHVFGFGSGEVIIFAIAANVVAGVSTVVSGRFDDRFGPKRIVLVALVGLVVTGTAVFVLRDAGQSAFWVGGLLLCLFVGPAQAASRSMMARFTTAETEGELFGLYQTTGKAATFLAPAMFGLFVAVFGADAFGILGIVVVLIVGLALLIPVRAGAR